MADFGARPLLPHGSQGFQEPREKQKNYVFVDEHNRHRRLKVMRACAACRKRKIKCDAATTNTWPCPACVKQNLDCIPPSAEKDGGFDSDTNGPKSAPLPGTSNDPTFGQFPPTSSYPQPIPHPTKVDFSFGNSGSFDASSSFGPSSWGSSYTTDTLYPNAPTSNPFTQQYPFGYQSQDSSNAPPRSKSPSSSSDAVTWKSDNADSDISEAFQDLKISHDAIAPYITNQRTLAEGPAVEEEEVVLPPLAGPNSTVSIPAEMLPSSQHAMQLIEFFFTNIHPYVPVVNRPYFNRQWRLDRQSISPLVLEGIFACSSFMLGQRQEGARWLALAARHEESFKDVPRLSTIQGLVLVLKAREATPKRGYYYRSWTLVQYLISMAKDLELDKHNELHCRGKSCDSASHECGIKTRVWHTLFALELIIGGPQGRYEFSTNLDTINTESFQYISGVDESEHRISQDHIQVVRIVKNIRLTSRLFVTGKKRDANFAVDPDFTQHNNDFEIWMQRLPPHLQIAYKSDGSPPWIPFHFVANLHCYHLLSVVMHHRPQIDFSPGADHDLSRQKFATCYTAATQICRLHEAVVQKSGLNGLLCMLRGINLAIYTVLTCTMLHLAAITSPDPELNMTAKDYFTRHMRILEKCSKEWPMPSMLVQIESLRKAFSADTSRPFELRANFPFGSPVMRDMPSPPSDNGYGVSNHRISQSEDQSTWAYEALPLTPPKSASSLGPAGDFGSAQALPGTDMQNNSGASISQGANVMEFPPQWDPTGLFDRWSTAFNTTTLDPQTPEYSGTQPPPASTLASQTSMPYTDSSTDYLSATYGQTPTTPMTPTYPSHMTSTPTSLTSVQSQAMMPQQQSGYTTPAPAMQQPYMTPSMWQDVVAKSYGEGLKRRLEDSGHGMGHSYKRMR